MKNICSLFTVRPSNCFTSHTTQILQNIMGCMVTFRHTPSQRLQTLRRDSASLNHIQILKTHFWWPHPLNVAPSEMDVAISKRSQAAQTLLNLTLCPKVKQNIMGSVDTEMPLSSLAGIHLNLNSEFSSRRPFLFKSHTWSSLQCESSPIRLCYNIKIGLGGAPC